MKADSVQGLDRLLVRRWRREAGLSRPQAAERLGISPRMLAYYEDGVHDVPKSVMLAIRMLASESGIRLPGQGMDRARWVRSVGHAVAYGRGEPIVGRLVRQGMHSELRDLLQLLKEGPPPDMALTDPALFRTLREAGTKAWLSGLGEFTVPEREPAHAPRAAAG